MAARDLTGKGTLIGGRCLEWIDEEAFIFTSCQLATESVVTRTIREINFLATTREGDIIEIEIGMEAINFRRPSITIACLNGDMRTTEIITAVDNSYL